MTMETPNNIKTLLAPVTKKESDRKVWSIDLHNVWLPFFTATNAQGDTAIPHDALGCPLRLGYDKAGNVRFSQSGKPVIRVAKELSSNIQMVRDNFTANLLNYAESVANGNTEAYKHEIEAARKASEPIYKYDNNQLSLALKAKADREAKAEAEKKAEADRIKAEALKEAQIAVNSGNGKKEKVHA